MFKLKLTSVQKGSKTTENFSRHNFNQLQELLKSMSPFLKKSTEVDRLIQEAEPICTGRKKGGRVCLSLYRYENTVYKVFYPLNFC